MIDKACSFLNSPYFLGGCLVMVGTFLICKVAQVVLPIIKKIGTAFYYSRFYTSLIIPFNSSHVNMLTLERKIKNTPYGDASSNNTVRVSPPENIVS